MTIPNMSNANITHDKKKVLNVLLNKLINKFKEKI